MTLQGILFGFGRAGKIHYHNLINNKNLKLTHIIEMYDISEEINKDIQYINYQNKEEINKILGNNNIKFIIIASPTSIHYELIMLGLQNNKHVFVEKPITENYEEIQKCFELAKEKNLKLFVGYNRRYDPKIKNIKKRIDNNEIGKVNYALTISRDYPYPTENFLKISGGIFHDCATHDIDYINWILNDKPISVSVLTEDNNSNSKGYNFDHVTINLKYSTGTIVCLNLSRIASSYDQRCEFYGSEGEIINNTFKKGAKLSFPQRYKKAFENELKEFYNCIIKNKDPLVTKNECLNNFDIAEACQESFDKQKKITIKYGNIYRNYENANQSVINNYFKARKYQTLDYVLNMKKKFSSLDEKMEIWDILEDLNNLTDVSDPDCSHPNLYHAIQTAEKIRKDNKPEWMQLMGLLHDIGKIMYKKGSDNEGTGIKEQWGMVGDTFIVGCQLPDNIIFPEFNRENPDMKNNKYNTQLGIYREKCGMDNLHCSWGHDEYLYIILSSDKNPNILPKEALYIARFHSLYSYHDKKEYFYFQNENDKQLFPYLIDFNKYDLYSKSDEIYEINQIKEYYMGLIQKFFTNTYLYI